MARKKIVLVSCFNPLKLKNHAKTKKKELTKIHVEWLKRLNIPITPTSTKYLICGSCRLKVWRMPKVENDTGHNESDNIANTDTGTTQPTTKNDQGVRLASKHSRVTTNRSHVLCRLKVLKMPKVENDTGHNDSDNIANTDTGTTQPTTNNDQGVPLASKHSRVTTNMPYVLLEDFTRFRSKDDCRSSEAGVVNDARNIVKTCSNPVRLENHDQCSTHNVRRVTTNAADQCTEGDTRKCNSCRMECTGCHGAEKRDCEKPVQAPAPQKIRAPVSESQSVSTNHDLTASRSTDENLNQITKSSDLALPKPPTDVKRKYSSAEKKRTRETKSVKYVRLEQDLEEGYIEVLNEDHHRLVEVVETIYNEKDGKHTEHRKRVSFQ